MRQYVNNETRTLIEEQFAECLSFDQLAELYADFQCILRELLVYGSKALTENSN